MSLLELLIHLVFDGLVVFPTLDMQAKFSYYVLLRVRIFGLEISDMGKRTDESRRQY